jgi:hypothetical protein
VLFGAPADQPDAASRAIACVASHRLRVMAA